MSTPNKKLLYIINHIDWFWSHRLPLAEGAQRAGWNITVAAPMSEPDGKLTKRGFTAHPLPISGNGNIFRALLNFISVIFSLHTLLKQERPSIVHAVTLKYAFITGLVLRLFPDIKAVHTIAGLGYLFSADTPKARTLRFVVAPLLKLALRRPKTKLIFQNPDDMNLMLSLGYAKPKQCHLIRGSGVDLDTFRHVPEPQNDTPVILMPTRLVKNKGISIYVEAARLYKQQGGKAEFLLAGGVSSSNPLSYTRREIESLCSDGIVKWLGKVDDMPALYSRSNLIVYPSWYGEGIPKVLLEAAACGRAIITTDHPGCREAVIHDTTGLLIPVKDAKETVLAIQELLADKTTRSNMGNAARQYAEKEFSIEKVVHKTLEVYVALDQSA